MNFIVTFCHVACTASFQGFDVIQANILIISQAVFFRGSVAPGWKSRKLSLAALRKILVYDEEFGRPMLTVIGKVFLYSISSVLTLPKISKRSTTLKLQKNGVETAEKNNAQPGSPVSNPYSLCRIPLALPSFQKTLNRHPLSKQVVNGNKTKVLQERDGVSCSATLASREGLALG